MRYIQNAPQIMWFLGAGVSRSAGMPTATDIIWDLKRKYYCLKEDQSLSSQDLHNEAVQYKIQRFMKSQGFPPLGSAEEYSFYFKLIFRKDYAAQQTYISEILASDKISLSIGHRVLAALLGMGLARIVFTTNFDDVIETAYSSVIGKSLSPFHLEGSYAALDALNAERFPIYAKLHGDFRYRSIKNLPEDLLGNDQQIQKCFLAAANRYGLIVTGYSGRDKNVMAMFEDALRQNNAFPKGLFWTTTYISSVSDPVRAFIAAAQDKGVQAHLVEVGTFDTMMSKIWRQIPDKPPELESKVYTATVRSASIPLPPPGKRYPILRMNALPVLDVPKRCAQVDYDGTIMRSDLNARVLKNAPNAIFTYTDRILFWGEVDAANRILDNNYIKGIHRYVFDDPAVVIQESGILKAFFEEGIVRALCQDKPLWLNRMRGVYYIVVARGQQESPILQPLKDALSYKSNPSYIVGAVNGLEHTYWAEALSLKLEVQNGLLWLLVRPDIWISPLSMRENATDFLRGRKLRRYNNVSYDLLNAWITVLLGSVGKGRDVQISYLPDSDYPADFRISTRTAYSQPLREKQI